MEPILKVDALTRRFGGVTALDSLSFSMQRHEKLAIIGPNGAGKSTLLKLIAGQDRPTSGSIFLEGAGQVQGNKADQMARAGIALARQVPRPLHSLTVRENIQIGIAAGRTRSDAPARERIDRILELSALAPVHDRVAGSLPLLDLKRLEVAKALASNPRIILLDEVSAGLNEVELDSAIELISTIHASGTAVILVEHVQRVIHELADRVLVLNWGALLTEGTPAEVTANEEVRRVYLGVGRVSVPQPDHIPTESRTKVHGAGLTVTGLTVKRDSLVVLRNIDFAIAPGEVVAVLGSNGAGKSTLAQSISGILRSESGRIEWAGADITRAPSFARARLGIAHCQEGRKLFPGMTVRQNLELGAYGQPAREIAGRADEVLTIFPALAERESQIATTMSGGQQQMLAIGRALMSRPQLLICDEVTLGLSPKIADEIYESFSAVVRTGSSIVLIEQDAARCLSVASRAYVLSHGSVAYSGPACDLTEAMLVSAYLGNPTSLSKSTSNS
jgi:branched-chain amino acid transport system ATP-binding protein